MAPCVLFLSKKKLYLHGHCGVPMRCLLRTNLYMIEILLADQTKQWWGVNYLVVAWSLIFVWVVYKSSLFDSKYINANAISPKVWTKRSWPENRKTKKCHKLKNKASANSLPHSSYYYSTTHHIITRQGYFSLYGTTSSIVHA